MRHSFAGLFVAGAFAATLALSPSAIAQPKKPATAAAAAPSLADAKKHYGEGEKKYKAGDFAGALPEFQAADAVKSTPQSQRYIGLCQDNLGHYAEAVASYEKFLAAVPAKMKKEGDEITRRVEQIKAMPAHLHIESTPTGASIVIDGKPMGTAPADVEVASGKHILHMELDGYLPNDRDLDLAYASKQDIKAELEAKPVAPPVATTPPPVEAPVTPPPPKPEAPKEARSKLPAFITGGLAIVAVGLGTGFGIAALAKKSEFDTTPTADIADTGENFALVADMAFGVAITLGVTSAVLFLTNDEDSTPRPANGPTTQAKRHPVRIIPAPYITPHGAGAGALLRF
jgi:hypothetical protein